MWNKIRKTDEDEFIISKCELELMLEQASREGAKQALTELGLHDENAPTDIRDLRELLRAFRIAKKDSFRILVKCIVIGFVTILTAGFISLIGDHIKIK
jgi:Family of unknown function (DUF6127)